MTLNHTNVTPMKSTPMKSTAKKAKVKSTTTQSKSVAAPTPTTPAATGKFGYPDLFPTKTSLPKPSGYSVPAAVDPVLTEILSWRRPHESEHEKAFVTWLCAHLTKLGYKPTMMTTEENVVVEVPRPDKVKSTTLFSSHTDTVHSRSMAGSVPRQQKIAYDAARGEIFLEDGKQGDCLGADDGSGIWLMLEMIKAKVPGTYVFHRGEERGCIGSHAMVKEKSAWLAQYDVAVAFDRKGFTEIITHQSAGRCASDKCGTALKVQLEKHGLKDMELSPHGSVTDTMRYRGVVAECFNLAVGYGSNHGPHEYQDYSYLVALRDALVKVDWDSLPVDRDPKAADPVKKWPTYPTGSTYTPPKPAAKHTFKLDAVEEFTSMSHDDLVVYLSEYPDDAAEAIGQILIELVRARAERDLYKKRGGF